MPVVKLDAPAEEKPSERTLSSDEIRAVGAAPEAEDRIGAALRLGFYTGSGEQFVFRRPSPIGGPVRSIQQQSSFSP